LARAVFQAPKVAVPRKQLKAETRTPQNDRQRQGLERLLFPQSPSDESSPRRIQIQIGFQGGFHLQLIGYKGLTLSVKAAKSLTKSCDT